MTDPNQNNGADRMANSSMTQRNADAPLNPRRATMPTTDPVREIGKRMPKSSDAESQAPTITEQIYSFFQRERVDRGYGNYQPSRHPANIEPLDQLLGPAGKVKDKD
jgi:hypothetical protein